MLKLLEREASPQLELNDSLSQDNLMVRIKDLIGGSQCISAGFVQESVRKAEHGNGKSHRRPRKDAAAKADVDNVLEERNPQCDVMLSQMVGRIRSKLGGKLEMGENKELYQMSFANEEKQAKFLRWTVQFLARRIRKLDFNPGGTCTIFQVSDLKNSPGPGKRELRIANKQALQMLEDSYPKFVAKQVFINVPWWCLAFYAMIIPFMTHRTKSKFVFASPSRTAETFFKYIFPEQVPVQYGGLSVDYCDCVPEFTVSNPATKMTVKPETKQIVEIIIYEKCVITWELRVVGWEVSCGAEFVPNSGGYSINIQKPKKMSPADEPVVHGTFKVSELGKVLLTVDNPTSKKKKLLYKFKIDLLGD